MRTYQVTVELVDRKGKTELKTGTVKARNIASAQTKVSQQVRKMSKGGRSAQHVAIRPQKGDR